MLAAKFVARRAHPVKDDGVDERVGLLSLAQPVVRGWLDSPLQSHNSFLGSQLWLLEAPCGEHQSRKIVLMSNPASVRARPSFRLPVEAEAAEVTPQNVPIRMTR